MLHFFPYLKVLLDDSTLTVLPHRSTKTESHGIDHSQSLGEDVCAQTLWPLIVYERPDDWESRQFLFSFSILSLTPKASTVSTCCLFEFKFVDMRRIVKHLQVNAYIHPNVYSCLYVSYVTVRAPSKRVCLFQILKIVYFLGSYLLHSIILT